MSDVRARNPKKNPCPEDFETFDKFILCAYDAQEWFDGVRRYAKNVFQDDRPPTQSELNIIVEQQAHWDFYKKMRDNYWEAKQKYNESQPYPSYSPAKSFRDIETGCRCRGYGSCQCD